MINSAEKTYAGVLGKILGVYLGRPVEGWTYDAIKTKFGEILYYQNIATGAPLIVPDDDISGTFTFIRSLEDNGYAHDISAEQIGDTWLNYIIENQTILWWGGLSRSTEHTAFLRLKEGIKAPRSGSVELNGRSMAEQIGSQIFIDSWAMANPGNPERAAWMARNAASVSHGGMAIDAACYLAAMEAMAYEERDINRLLDENIRYVNDATLLRLIEDIRNQCAKYNDWKDVRSWIAKNHGYDRYPGNCPMATNHLVVLMSLIMAGDDFHRSISIASSAGWDTDCNSGNVGCLNGIRLGLEGIDAGLDLRSAIADRLYVVTSDGGECISDAVQEARKLIKAAAILDGKTADVPKERFAFEFPGSVQGFHKYENSGMANALVDVENASSIGEKGLLLRYKQLAPGAFAAACVETFCDNKPKGKEGTSYFDVLTSPSLYEGQTVKAVVSADENPPALNFFIEYFNGNDNLCLLESELSVLSVGDNNLEWEVPSTGGHMIYRVGIRLQSDVRRDGTIILKTMDWAGSPKRFSMGKSMDLTPSLTPWTISTTWIKAFMRTAEQFYPDYTTTFSVSHSGKNGVTTIGTRDWKDYAVASTLTLAQQEGAGLVARARGHRRYYAAVLRDGCAFIELRKDGQSKVLASALYPYEIDKTYKLRFELKGDKLKFIIDGIEVLSATDNGYTSGGAGFLVETGAMLADGFVIESLEEK